MTSINATIAASATPPAPPTQLALSGKKPKGPLRRLSKWGRDWSGFIGILLAVAGFCVGGYQTWLARENARISVRPHMRVATYFEGVGSGKKTGLYLTNLGLGPATLDKLTLEVGGQTYDLMQPHGQEVAVKAMGFDSLCVMIVLPEPGTILKVNEEGPLLATTASAIAPVCVVPVMRALDNREIKVHMGYSSMRGEAIEDTQTIHLDIGKHIDMIQAMIQTALAAPAPAPAGKPSARGGPPSPPAAK